MPSLLYRAETLHPGLESRTLPIDTKDVSRNSPVTGDTARGAFDLCPASRSPSSAIIVPHGLRRPSSGDHMTAFWHPPSPCINSAGTAQLGRSNNRDAVAREHTPALRRQRLRLEAGLASGPDIPARQTRPAEEAAGGRQVVWRLKLASPSVLSACPDVCFRCFARLFTDFTRAGVACCTPNPMPAVILCLPLPFRNRTRCGSFLGRGR